MIDSDDEDLNPTKESVIKLCLLGNGASGKTSIATVLAQNSFNKQYAQTVGLDFFRRREELPGGRVVQLQIWDVGGQQIGGSLLPTYISGAQGILFVYDVTNQQSFDDLEDWMKVANNVLATSDITAATTSNTRDETSSSVHEQQEKSEGDSEPKPSAGGGEEIREMKKTSCHFALVGNKVDLQHMVAISPERHHRFASEHCMSSHLVCASRADGIQLMIKKITAAILKVKLDRATIEQSQSAIAASVNPQREQPHVPHSANHRAANPSSQSNTATGSGDSSNSNACSIQ
ncbi:ras-related protein Rab-28-like [Symsagittifera roscoffensis]|uniref:ras-related protein Rab-28-like n=1 Tax=Symsagittifera roscoffensis TaxID=84072 RepID=UPI00307BB0BA